MSRAVQTHDLFDMIRNRLNRWAGIGSVATTATPAESADKRSWSMRVRSKDGGSFLVTITPEPKP